MSPRASRTRIVDIHDNRLKIQLAAPPVEGKANESLVRFIAGQLEVSRGQVGIVGGLSSRRKTVRVMGVTLHLALVKLAPRSR